MNILALDSSPSPTSASRAIVEAAVAALSKAPGSRVVYRDLAANPPTHFGAEALKAARPAPGEAAAQNEEAAQGAMLLDEFMQADVVVIGAPMYNFSVPTQLKAWMDRMAVAGKTFVYSAEGPRGLAGAKRVIVASTRGGAYAGQDFEAALDHQEAYLSTFFKFIGVERIEFIRAEGQGMPGAAEALALAIAAARNLAPSA